MRLQWNQIWLSNFTLGNREENQNTSTSWGCFFSCLHYLILDNKGGTMSELASINHVYTPKQKLNDTELLRAIKFAIVSEFEAIQIYQQIAEATNNVGAKRVILDIAREEKQHVGELRELLKVLAPYDEDEYLEGAEETKENLEK